MKNVWLKRVRHQSPQHQHYLLLVWLWMLKQPIYLEVTGYETFEQFCQPTLPHVFDVFAFEGDELIAFFEVIGHDEDEVEFHFCMPPRPRLRSVIVALQQMQDDLFNILHASRIFAWLPEGERREPTFKLAQKLNFIRVSSEECAITRESWLKSKSQLRSTIAA